MSFLDDLPKNQTTEGMDTSTDAALDRSAILFQSMRKLQSQINEENIRKNTQPTELDFKTAGNYQIPVVYGDAWVTGSVTDAVLLEGPCILWCFVTLCEATGDLLSSKFQDPVSSRSAIPSTAAVVANALADVVTLRVASPMTDGLDTSRPNPSIVTERSPTPLAFAVVVRLVDFDVSSRSPTPEILAAVTNELVLVISRSAMPDTAAEIIKEPLPNNSRSAMLTTDELSAISEVDSEVIILSATPLTETAVVKSAEETTLRVASPMTEGSDTSRPNPSTVTVRSPTPDTAAVVVSDPLVVVTSRPPTPSTAVPAQTIVPVPGNSLSGVEDVDELPAMRLPLALTSSLSLVPDTEEFETTRFELTSRVALT